MRKFFNEAFPWRHFREACFVVETFSESPSRVDTFSAEAFFRTGAEEIILWSR